MDPLHFVIPAAGAALMMAAHSARADMAFESLDNIRQAAHDYAESHALENSAITVGTLDSRLRLPACAAPLSASAPDNARVSYSVTVRCDGDSGWTLYVPVKVDEHLQVLVLRRPVARGEKITAEHVVLREANPSATAYGYLTGGDQAIGQVAKRPLPAGAVLPPDALQAPRAVVRGQRVTLLGKSGAVEVHAEGKALGDAAAGERVRVENAASHRVVEGVAASDGSVAVAL